MVNNVVNYNYGFIVIIAIIIRKTETAFLECLIGTQPGIVHAHLLWKHYKIGKNLTEFQRV